MSAPPNLSGIARQFVRLGILNETIAAEAWLAARQKQTPFISYLVQSNLAKAAALAVVVAHESGDPLFDLDSLNADAIPHHFIDEKIIRQYNALPIFKRGNRISLAISDPTRLEVVDAFRFNTGSAIDTIVVEEDKLLKLIEYVLEGKNHAARQNLDTDLEEVSVSNDDDMTDDSSAASLASSAEDSPIVRYINKILLDAIRGGASDLHFEPYEKSYRIRFRIDGVLREIARLPIHIAANLAVRLKVMSQMDITERRLPQDGRIKLKLSKTRAIDLRVSSLPTLFGEKICLRILDSANAMLGIDALGYEPDQKALFLEALEKPQGMLLITGPTGSGKTVSLYTGLNILNTEKINISTVEDPVEIHLEGVNQVNVNPKAGLTFASALRAFLRQDPDIIMVGEIRDLETAEIAIKAAQTGHMVLSTLHTNSAPETLTRLRNMGVSAFNIATSVNLVIAQRLARRLCGHCKRPVRIPKESLLEMGFTEADLATDFIIYEPVGCDQCHHGYVGRLGVYEVMRITPTIARLIMEGGNAIMIATQARKEGFLTLRRSGLVKVMKGLTSLQEINRITSE